jgi:predicted chitinase
MMLTIFSLLPIFKIFFEKLVSHNYKNKTTFHRIDPFLDRSRCDVSSQAAFFIPRMKQESGNALKNRSSPSLLDISFLFDQNFQINSNLLP